MSQVLLTDESGSPIKATNPLHVTDTGNLTKLDEVIAAIRNIMEASVDTGIATAGTVNGITDTAKDWPVNGFTNLVVEITEGKGKGQIRRIASNTATVLTVDPVFAVAPDKTSQYRIAFFGKMASDITHIGGTAQTGRDWSEDLAKLDVALSTLATKVNQESIAGCIDQIEVYVDGLEAAMGTTADEEVSGNGSLISITKRLRSLLNGGLPATLSSGGGVKVGVVDSLPAGTNNIGKVDVNSSVLPSGASTESTLALIKAKTDNIPSDPSKESGKLTALETLITTLNEKIDTLDAVIDSIKDTDGIKKITDTVDVQLSGSNVEDVVKNVSIITTKHKQASEYDIYGVKWDKSSSPILTRTDDAVGLVANAGVGYQSVTNDFDKLPIFGEIEQVEDSLGNVFMKVPKFYCRDTDGTSHKQMQVSKRRYSGFYLPYLFWDFTNNTELDYALVGKHLGSLGTGNKLESKPNKYPLINKNIVDFRTYAKNNNVDGLSGYQQNDIHWVNLLRKLVFIEFATLDIQAIMKGYTEGQYDATHLATVTEENTNRIIIANAHADLYRVGQAISIGTSQGGNQIFYGRTITSIDVCDANNKAITFDGEPVTITTGNMLYNTGYKTGFSSQLLASSGSIVANDGKYPCVYRGIESPFGDVWEFVDGLNINDRQAWVCKNAANYASNLFASPYEQLGYVNHNANGYIQSMGFDPNFPFAQLPTAITGSMTPTQYYGDYYYQAAGQKIALFGGRWTYGSYAGLSYWDLYSSSSSADLVIGGRLLKKPL